MTGSLEACTRPERVVRVAYPDGDEEEIPETHAQIALLDYRDGCHGHPPELFFPHYCGADSGGDAKAAAAAAPPQQPVAARLRGSSREGKWRVRATGRVIRGCDPYFSARSPAAGVSSSGPHDSAAATSSGGRRQTEGSSSGIATRSAGPATAAAAAPLALRRKPAQKQKLKDPYRRWWHGCPEGSLSCAHCGATRAASWRRGSADGRPLCNPCYMRRYERVRRKAKGAAAAKRAAPAVGNGDRGGEESGLLLLLASAGAGGEGGDEAGVAAPLTIRRRCGGGDGFDDRVGSRGAMPLLLPVTPPQQQGQGGSWGTAA